MRFKRYDGTVIDLRVTSGPNIPFYAMTGLFIVLSVMHDNWSLFAWYALAVGGCTAFAFLAIIGDG